MFGVWVPEPEALNSAGSYWGSWAFLAEAGLFRGSAIFTSHISCIDEHHFPEATSYSSESFVYKDAGGVSCLPICVVKGSSAHKPGSELAYPQMYRETTLQDGGLGLQAETDHPHIKVVSSFFSSIPYITPIYTLSNKTS